MYLIMLSANIPPFCVCLCEWLLGSLGSWRSLSLHPWFPALFRASQAGLPPTMPPPIPSSQGLNSPRQPAPWASFDIQTLFPAMGISIIKIWQFWDHLIFIMEISILVRWQINRIYMIQHPGSTRAQNMMGKMFQWAYLLMDAVIAVWCTQTLISAPRAVEHWCIYMIWLFMSIIIEDFDF